MNHFILTGLVVVLCFISYQDFRERQVNWILFPSAFFLSILNSLQFVTVDKLLLNAGLNSMVVLILFLSLFIYSRFRFKGRKAFWQLIGLGDLLFFVVLTVNFTLMNFVLICLVSLILSLGISILYNQKTIPLAGVQAFCLFLVLLLQKIALINPFNEYWIYQWI